MKCNLKNIDTIIFDLGGVIVPVYTERTVKAFDQLTDMSTEQFYSYIGQIDLFNNLETGKFSEPEFRSGMRELIKSTASDTEIDAAWNAMLEDIPKAKLDILNNIKSLYRTFVLSNTNSIHMRWIDQYMLNNYGVNNLSPFFENTYYSHRINFRKPDPSAYEFVINENQLDPTKTLFIDDKMENLKPATDLGLQTFHMTDPDQFFELFT